MTIRAWIGFILIAIAIFLVAMGIGLCYAEAKGKSKVKFSLIGSLVGLTICGAIFGVLFWRFHFTESGKRAMKTQRSELTGGIERIVRVYDVEGDLIAEYEGKFDIEYDAERIVFDDENGKRHIIYYKTATVVIDEK